MSEQLCPTCGCRIGVDAYEKDGILYCCQPCATSGQCECGCCEAVESKREQESSLYENRAVHRDER